MAGHSKWANIKHRKAAQDAKRGKIFTKLIRELVVAAREGGAEVADNPRLRQVVDKALTANMKRDTIDKAIARGAGNADGDNFEERTYEGYGVGGVAVLCETMTDNVNRTVSQVRAAFTKCGGSLGTNGSVAYLFERKGQIFFESDIDEELLMEVALEAGAEDVLSNDDGSFEVRTDWTEFLDVKEALAGKGFEGGGEVSMIADTLVPQDLDGAQKTMRLIDMLEDLDDVQNVYTNADIPEEILEQL